MEFRPDINTIKLLKALDNSLRLMIIEFVINSSPVSFTGIKENLETQTGREINRGTMSYHLDILTQSNILTRELGRTHGERNYSSYDITEYAREKLDALGLLVMS